MKPLSERIKDCIIHNADETKYRYEIGKRVIDNLVKDIVIEVNKDVASLDESKGLGKE